MAVTYPISLPETPGCVRWRIRQENAVGVSESPFTYDQQVYKWPGARWRVDFTIPPMREGAILRPWIGALSSLQGRYGTFLFGDPNRKAPRGVATGTPRVLGAGQTGSVLLTDGWTPSTTGILKAGDLIGLGSGNTTRMHILFGDPSSNGSGESQFDIWPPLRYSPADDAAIATSNCKTQFRLDQDFEWSVDNLPVTGVTITAHEALP